jgi:hypothetical protein
MQGELPPQRLIATTGHAVLQPVLQLPQLMRHRDDPDRHERVLPGVACPCSIAAIAGDAASDDYKGLKTFAGPGCSSR